MRRVVFLALALTGPSLFPLPAIGAEEVKPVVITPDKDPRIDNGTFSEFSAASDDKGPVMAMEGLSIFQPVRVSLISNDPAVKIHLKITKPGGTDIIFDGQTNEKGSVTAKFRSQGDIRMVATSSPGRNRFSMIVWVGDTLAPKPQSVLRPIP